MHAYKTIVHTLHTTDRIKFSKYTKILVTTKKATCNISTYSLGPAAWIFTICHGICRLPWNLLLAAEKCGIAHFCNVYTNSRFFGLPFNFTIYKTIKSSRCKLTFMIIMCCAYECYKFTWSFWPVLTLFISISFSHIMSIMSKINSAAQFVKFHGTIIPNTLHSTASRHCCINWQHFKV